MLEVYFYVVTPETDCFLYVSVVFSYVNASIITNPKSTPITTHCEYYNGSACANGSGPGCPEKEECSPHDPGKRNHCFVLWHLEPNGERTIKLKGCFLNSIECYNRSECVEKSQLPKKSLLFCCCEGDMCNQNFTWNPSPTEIPKLGASGTYFLVLVSHASIANKITNGV